MLSSGRPMAVQVTLSRLLIREMTDLQFVEFAEVGGTRRFPIAIGLPEAFAIERRCKGLHPERPQTHDLLANVIEALGAKLIRMEIDELSNGTFHAKLILLQGGVEHTIDARPSDAIALAAAGDTPIFVADQVIEEASIESNSPEPSFGDDEDDDVELTQDEDEDDLDKDDHSEEDD